MKIFLSILLLNWLVNGIYSDEIDNDSKLVVFVNSEKTIVTQNFEKNALDKIKKLADEAKVKFQVMESANGLPAEITTLPAILFYGPTGRSIYQGRYLSFDRILNFVETSQNISQTALLGTHKNVPVAKNGRAFIGVPIKIAEVTGVPPKDYDFKTFHEKSFKVILKELHGYEFKELLNSNRSDRFFYMDFYPWVSKEGQLYLSASLFSQFHCKVPIWTTGKSPFVGGWKDQEILFKQATARMEEEINKQKINSNLGDDFDSVPNETKIVSWEDLGLKVEEKKKVANAINNNQIPNDWSIDSKLGHKGTVLFRLAPPNENYSGFAKTINGNMNLNSSVNEKKLSGSFKVKMDSVTMGDIELDSAILGKEMINALSFPVASFDFAYTAKPEDFNLQFGSESIFDVTGKFTFKDKTIPLKVEFSLEPIVKKNKTILFLNAKFRIDLKVFGLTGAPDESAEKDILEFFIHLEMVGSEK
jgi:polyisoprenoid-binding protein YceI